LEPIRLDTDGLPFSSSRKFQLWSYVASHGQLLLRSNKEPDVVSTRLEVLFKATRFVCLPGVINGLTIRRGDGEMVRRHFSDLSSLDLEHGAHTFEVSGDGWNGFVVAGAIWTVEDDAEYYHRSQLVPGINAFEESP
jgi:hypothetical protein